MLVENMDENNQDDIKNISKENNRTKEIPISNDVSLLETT